MAIQFARIEYVSRSSGGNACRKAAYNQREEITCERTGEVFNFKHKTDLSYHEVLLPEGVSDRFKESSFLWNAAENAERRRDSQVAKESVIALPDDKIITMEDRIELAKRYAHILFVSKGLAVQLDIHAPHDDEKNWHAHLLITTRRFSKDGETFLNKKARETDPTIRNGYIKEDMNPGEVWARIQNSYFQEKGYDLTVDPTGFIPQEHIGPVRMRAHLTEAVARAEILRESNEEEAKKPEAIIQKLTKKSSIFQEKDIDRFLEKFVEEKDRSSIKEKILSHKSLIDLYDPKTGQEAGYFTTKEVREEEEKLLRFAEKVHQRGSILVSDKSLEKSLAIKDLSDEQRQAVYHVACNTKGIAFVQGRAGTGKSYTMNAVRDVYESSGIPVRGIAPTNVVAGDMAKDGFRKSSTVHKLLFDLKNGRESIPKGSVIIVDEAAMLGNSVLVELLNVAKENRCKLVLFGDSHQLSSVERGGMFEVLAQRYGGVVLQDVRRQRVEWQKDVSIFMGRGFYEKAIQTLSDNQAIHWSTSKEETLSDLIKSWEKSYQRNKDISRLVIAGKNVDVDALNRGIREVRLMQGDISPKGYELKTTRGLEVFSENDRVCFTKTDKEIGVSNGVFGIIEKLSEKECTVRLDNKKTVTFNPEDYAGLKLGYASTIYKSQGKTIDEVYVLHDRHANRKLSYVALSRQSQDLKLFVNREETHSLKHLISQVSRDTRNISSLEFKTSEELQKQAINENSPFQKVKEAISSVLISIKDKFYHNDDFYRISSKPHRTRHEVKIVDQSNLIQEIRNQSSQFVKLETKEKRESSLSQQARPELKGPSYPNKVHDRPDKIAVVNAAFERRFVDLVETLFSGEKVHSRTRKTVRYGNKGSLLINVSGQYKGTFTNFETGESGNALKLIQERLSYGSLREAFKWAYEWAGGSHLENSQTPPSEKSLKPDSKHYSWRPVFPAPSTFPDIKGNPHLNYLLEGRQEVARYPYKDKMGKILGYVVRLEDKDGFKITPTLTYCQNEQGQQHWRWKGFGENRPLYGLDRLDQGKPVLIVEGEKTADAAQKLLPEYAVLSWPGGAGAVHKADWSPLVGRDVTIWPDNDETGKKASENIKKRLSDLNTSLGKSTPLKIVSLPKDLPQKWDLADPLPPGMTFEALKDLLMDRDKEITSQKTSLELKREEFEKERLPYHQNWCCKLGFINQFKKIARSEEELHLAFWQAERLTAIEGRLYKESLEQFLLKTKETLKKEARLEFFKNQSLPETLKEFGKEFGLSTSQIKYFEQLVLYQRDKIGNFPTHPELDSLCKSVLSQESGVNNMTEQKNQSLDYALLLKLQEKTQTKESHQLTSYKQNIPEDSYVNKLEIFKQKVQEMQTRESDYIKTYQRNSVRGIDM